MATPSGSIVQLTSPIAPPRQSSGWAPTSMVSPEHSVVPSGRFEVKQVSFESAPTETKISLLAKRQISLAGVGEIPQLIWRGYAAAPPTLHIPPKEPCADYSELRQKFHAQIKANARWGSEAQETISEEQLLTLSICAAKYFSKSAEAREICGFESYPRKGHDKKVQLFFEGDSLRICLVIERSCEAGSMKRIGRSLMINLYKESSPQSILFYRQIRVKGHPSAYRSMERECEILVGLDHPNILPIFHAALYVNSKGNAQVVMGVPCFESSLSKIINTKAPLPSFLDAAKSLVKALLKCHSAGIYHADLKPANMVMNAAKSMVLIDFGNANGDFGTLPYLPLDMVKKVMRDAHDPDVTVDMWSVGCILYIIYLMRLDCNNAHSFTENPLTESLFSKKIEAHMLLPWGELMQVYQRIENALGVAKKTSQAHLNEEETTVILDVHKRRDNILTNFARFDVSWIVPQSYASQPHCTLLIWLQEIDFVLAKTIHFAKKGHDIGLDQLPSLLILLEKKLQEMQMALEKAPQPTTPELQILHATLQPQKTKRATAAQLSELLAKTP